VADAFKCGHNLSGTPYLFLNPLLKSIPVSIKKQ
jgi:hypothetical protein